KVIEQGDDMSTIGDDEVKVMWPVLYGYKATKSDQDAWRGTESNTAMRKWAVSAEAVQSANQKAADETVKRLSEQFVSKDKEIATLKSQVGDGSKWQTLRALVRELIGV